MTYYADRLAGGELPLWNPQWGFGFPALAESQMGVFYPPHLLLYGLFDIDLAYGLNMLVHALLAAGFAFWCGRAFGLRPWGAALTAIVFFTTLAAGFYPAIKAARITPTAALRT